MLTSFAVQQSSAPHESPSQWFFVGPVYDLKRGVRSFRLTDQQNPEILIVVEIKAYENAGYCLLIRSFLRNGETLLGRRGPRPKADELSSRPGIRSIFHGTPMLEHPVNICQLDRDG